jgi:hypothetical protein
MTLDEAIKHCEDVAAKCFVERSARNHSGKCGFEHLELAAWLRELKAYKEQEPYVDAISREAAIRWVKTECNPYGKPTIDFESGKKVIEHLKQMPSVTPKQKTGEWIPVSERLPNDRDWYLGIFKEPDTGWINPLPFICDYVGNKTKATTKEHWILRGFTDRDERIGYYVNLECVAWMPLPEPYKAESEGEKHHLTKQSKMVTDDKAQRKEEHI